MNKIKTIIALIASMMLFSSAANSVEFKVGLSGNASGYYANAKETIKGTGAHRTSNAEAVALFHYASGFVEVGSEELMGLSIGLSYAPEVASLPTETRLIQNCADHNGASCTSYSSGDTGTQKIDGKIVDQVVLYATLPVGSTGAYGKLGFLRATLETNELLATGSKYEDVDLEAIVVGAGYEGSIGSNAFWRIEGTYHQFDDVRVNGSQSNSDTDSSTNKIDAEIGGVNAALSIGYKF